MRFISCTHPDHNANESCEERTISCHPDCDCCNTKTSVLWNKGYNFDYKAAEAKAVEIAESELKKAVYAEQNSERWSKLSEGEREKLKAEFVGKKVNTFLLVSKWILEENWDKLVNNINKHNPAWKAVFEAGAGLKLGNTKKEIEPKVIEWIGRDKYDVQIAMLQAKADDAAKAREQEWHDKAMQETLREGYRYAMGGQGLANVVTFQQMVADLISRGFTRVESKRGVAEYIHLCNGEGGFVRFRKKLQIEYIREQLNFIQV